MKSAAFAPDLRAGCVGREYAFRKCRFIPPHQSLTRQLPSEGKPSLRGANKANMILRCSLPAGFALICYLVVWYERNFAQKLPGEENRK